MIKLINKIGNCEIYYSTTSTALWVESNEYNNIYHTYLKNELSPANAVKNAVQIARGWAA